MQHSDEKSGTNILNMRIKKIASKSAAVPFHLEQSSRDKHSIEKLPSLSKYPDPIDELMYYKFGKKCQDLIDAFASRPVVTKLEATYAIREIERILMSEI